MNCIGFALISLVCTVAVASGSQWHFSTKPLETKVKDAESVIILDEDGTGVPITRLKSAISTAEYEKAHSMEDDDAVDDAEEGVGPAVSFDYSSELDKEKDPMSTSDGDHNEAGEKPEEDREELKVVYSELNPVYVKPPTGFKPIIYPNRRIDGVNPNSKQIGVDETTLPARPPPYPYPFPYGVSSWFLGGLRAMERGGFWENMATDTALHTPNIDNVGEDTIVTYTPVKRPVQVPTWPKTVPLPTYLPPLRPSFSTSRFRPYYGSRPERRPTLPSWLRNNGGPNWGSPNVIEQVNFVPYARTKPTSSSSSSFPFIYMSSSSPASSNSLFPKRSSHYPSSLSSSSSSSHPSLATVMTSLLNKNNNYNRLFDMLMPKQDPVIVSLVSSDVDDLRKTQYRPLLTAELYFDDETGDKYNTVNVEE